MFLKHLVFCVGDECNKNCSYCFEKHNKRYEFPHTLTDDMRKWLSENITKFNRLTIVGGETLLYLDTIYELLDLAPLYMKKMVITNGTLLTNNIVDKLNSYNTTIQISHDGELTNELRGFDVLSTNLDVIKRIEDLSVVSTITAKNLSIVNNYQYIKNILQDKEFKYSFNIYMNKSMEDDLLVGFDYGMLRKQLIEIHVLYSDKLSNRLSYYKNRDDVLGTQLLLNGDVIELKTAKKYGNIIYDKEEDIIDRINADFTHCISCQYDAVCFGKRQLANEHICKTFKAIYEAKEYIEKNGAELFAKLHRNGY